METEETKPAVNDAEARRKASDEARAELVALADSGGTDKVTNLARLIVAIGGLDRD